MTSAIGLAALVLSLNPEWIADKKLLKRIEKNGRLKDVCLSIYLSRCGNLVIESDLAPCIIVQSRVERMGFVSKSHLYVSDSYHSEVEELASSGLLRGLEKSAVASISTGAYAGYQITGEWIRLSEKMESRLVKYRVGESLFSHKGAFIDYYATNKLFSLQMQEVLCVFPDIELKEDWAAVPVLFVPVLQVKGSEFAIAFFPGHEYGFARGYYVMTFQPITRPVNLGESQFDNLEGHLTASIESVEESINPDGQLITRVGLRYTNAVLNA